MVLQLFSNRILAAITLACALFILLMNLVFINVMMIVLGLLLTLTSVLRLTRPAAVFYTNRLELKNGFGMTIRTKPFSSPRALEMQGNVLYATEEGQQQKLAAFSSFAYNSSDVQKLREWIDYEKGMKR